MSKTEQAQEVLKKSTVEGNTVKLPAGQLDREVYMEVKKHLELIGGKWKGGKIAGFVFDSDPTGLLLQISSGEKRNLKKEFQFFATPSWLAEYLVQLAEVKPGISVLEPSAGQGSIVDAIRKLHTDNPVFLCEQMPTNHAILRGKYESDGSIFFLNPTDDDFLQMPASTHFGRIIANPPFSKNQDIDHIRKMYDVLAHGGRLVSVASTHWQFSENKKETEFVQWLKSLNAKIIDVEEGSFKESGTTVPAVIIIIDKL